jgi:hypothetical protein
MGKGKRVRERRRRGEKDAVALEAGWSDTNKIRMPGHCPECGRRPFLLSISVSLLRCDCGWQGMQFIQGPTGELLAFVTDEEPCPAEMLDELGTALIRRSFGPCLVTSTQHSIEVDHERGFLTYSHQGDLLEARGIFTSEHLHAARPPPCPCGSPNTTWVGQFEATDVIAEVAERLGRTLKPVRCNGRVWVYIEGYGGRAGRCRTCRTAVVYPTLPQELEDWLSEQKNTRHSLFVSYGGPDEVIAARIVDALDKQGVRTWFFPRDAVPGEKLHRVMFRGVNDHDRVLLICSKDSLRRPGVENEIERVLELEAREGGSSRLIPVTVDRFVFDDWRPSRPDLAQQVLSRVIVSFDSELPDMLTFRHNIDRLVSALEK